MRGSTFVPKIILRCFICLKQMDRMCWTIQIHSDELNWARRRTFHELNSLSLVFLMKSSTFGLCLSFLTTKSLLKIDEDYYFTAFPHPWENQNKLCLWVVPSLSFYNHPKCQNSAVAHREWSLTREWSPTTVTWPGKQNLSFGFFG